MTSADQHNEFVSRTVTAATPSNLAGRPKKAEPSKRLIGECAAGEIVVDGKLVPRP